VFSEAPTQFEIMPMDPEAENVLKAGPLSQHVTEIENDRVRFHQRAFQALEKIKPSMSFRNHDDLYFVYDCLFLAEAEFYSKYADLSKYKITSARKTVWEIFQK
jgi:hypothetical protein